jgi:hypothetical protein
MRATTREATHTLVHYSTYEIDRRAVQLRRDQPATEPVVIIKVCVAAAADLFTGRTAATARGEEPSALIRCGRPIGVHPCVHGSALCPRRTHSWLILIQTCGRWDPSAQSDNAASQSESRVKHCMDLEHFVHWLRLEPTHQSSHRECVCWYVLAPVDTALTYRCRSLRLFCPHWQYHRRFVLAVHGHTASAMRPFRCGDSCCRRRNHRM